MLLDPAPLGLVVLGPTLGMRHATDPDHVIAVTAILSSERRLHRAVRIGLAWGIGHSATLLTIGAAIIFFKLQVPARLGLALEFAVAIVLVLLGLGAAKRTLGVAAKWLRLSTGRGTLVVLAHHHIHKLPGSAPRLHHHIHVHSSADENGSASPHSHLLSLDLVGTRPGRSMLKSFGVGLVHGLAGGAAISLLITAAIPSPTWAALYLGIFCCGVVLGMMLITGLIAAPFLFAARRVAGIHRKLTLGAGWLSFGFGLFLAYRIGIVDQLFGVAPHWFPR